MITSFELFECYLKERFYKQIKHRRIDFLREQFVPEPPVPTRSRYTPEPKIDPADLKNRFISLAINAQAKGMKIRETY